MNSVTISLSFSEIVAEPIQHPASFNHNLDNFLAHSLNVVSDHEPADENGLDPYAEAAAIKRNIGVGQVYGYKPAFQISTEANQVKKYLMRERLPYIQSLGPLELHRTFKDEIEAAEYLGQTFVRNIGEN